MQKKHLGPTLTVLGIISLGLILFYSRVLLHPNATIMGGSSDAVKNYYTPWYHAKWDSSYTWFGGMNYPYGDHVVFADAQPLLSNAIKICGLADYTVGLINYAMLLSLLLTGWLLFRILLRWGVDVWWAAIAAACIALLSPQIMRFNGHFGLAYTFVVPLIWHLALRAIAQPGLLRSAALGGTVFLLGWLHPYYVMISAVFLSAFWLVYTILAWRETKLLHKLLHYGLQVLLPVALFTIVLKLTDPITDRPSNPFGIDQFTATWKTLFLPQALKYLAGWLPETMRGTTLSWEGTCYIGMVSVLALLGYGLRTSLRLGMSVLRRNWREFSWVEGEGASPAIRKLITISMLAGLLVGLFACGVPFAYKAETMTALFPPIKQFRSLGRFSWAFFYTWTSFAFYLVWQGIGWLRQRHLTWAGWLLGGIVVLVTLGEGAAWNAAAADQVAWANPPMANPNGDPIVLGAPMSPAATAASGNALVVLPYFHEGSENFHTQLPQNSRLAFQASIYTGLPMLDVMMSRTSLSQTWSMMQLLTEPEAHLEILDHLPEDAVIYALRTGYSDTLDGPLLRPYGATNRTDYIESYKIMRADLAKRSMADGVSLPDSTFPAGPNLRTNRPEPGLIWLDFEDEVGQGHRDGTEPGYAGGIGHRISLKDNNWLHEGPVQFQAGDTVIVSLWVKLREDGLPLTELGWEELGNGATVTWHYLSLNNSVKRLDGDWALCERQEVVHDPQNQIKINVTRWKRWPVGATIDKVMVRRKGTDVYGLEDGVPMWKNNRKTGFARPN